MNTFFERQEPWSNERLNEVFMEAFNGFWENNQLSNAERRPQEDYLHSLNDMLERGLNPSNLLPENKRRLDDRNDLPWIINWYDELARVLIRVGVDINKPSPEILNRTALQTASEWGRLDFVELLIEAGADINIAEPSNRNTALHFAAHKGHREICETLIKSGADTMLLNKEGKTPASMLSGRNFTSPLMK